MQTKYNESHFNCFSYFCVYNRVDSCCFYLMSPSPNCISPQVEVLSFYTNIFIITAFPVMTQVVFFFFSPNKNKRIQAIEKIVLRYTDSLAFHWIIDGANSQIRVRFRQLTGEMIELLGLGSHVQTHWGGGPDPAAKGVPVSAAN